MIVKFQDLPESIKAEKIADYAQYIGADDVEHTVEMFKDICATLFGINSSNVGIYYSINGGDDYLAYTCNWEYSPRAVKTLKTEFPQDKKLHTILDNWQKIQRKNFYRIFGSSECGRDIIRFNSYQDVNGYHCNCPEHIKDEIESVLNDLANHFLSTLRNEFEYQTSVENISNLLHDMEYEIDEDELIN